MSDKHAFIKVFKHIEEEVMSLSYSIEFDEGQKEVYSIQIAELILRCGSLIESVIKYQVNDPSAKYDDNKILNKLGIKDKEVVIVITEYKINKKEFSPFSKKDEEWENDNKLSKNNDENRTKKMQFGWNNAYQSLKHQFIQMIPKYGNIYYLFEILSVLAILLENSSIIFTNVEIDENGKKLGWKNFGNGTKVKVTL